MNIQNIDKAIAVMERATNLDMEAWQTGISITTANSISKLHACGNTACFAGYIAISEEFKADGGGVANGGFPKFNNTNGYHAIATWLGVSNWIADWFVHGNIICDNNSIEYGFSRFYNKRWHEVKSSDVIEKLKELKDLGEDAFFEKYDAL